MANYYIFRNLSMIAYMTKIKKSQIFDSVNLTNLSQGAKLNSGVYFHPVGYCYERIKYRNWANNNSGVSNNLRYTPSLIFPL